MDTALRSRGGSRERPSGAEAEEVKSGRDLVLSFSPGHCVLVALVLLGMGGFYYTHTTEVRALKTQLSALKSSTPAVLAPATPAPMAAAATAAPATAAQTGSTPTKAVPSKPAAGRSLPREGQNRATTPVAGKEPDLSVPPEMRKGGGFSKRIKRPTFTHEEKTSGQIVLVDFDPFLNNVSTPELERYFLAGEAAALTQPKLEKPPRPRPAQYSEAGMQVCPTYKNPEPLYKLLKTQQHWFCCYPESTMKAVCYAKMPKAASSAVHSAFNRLYAKCKTFKGIDRVKTNVPPGALFVTTTREPWSWIRSAYGEVDGWMSSLGNRGGSRHSRGGMDTKQLDPRETTRFFAMSRRDEPARFLTFLDDIFNFRFSAGASAVFYARHAHPQIAQVLDMPSINAVIRQESIEEDWIRVQDLLGVPTEKRVPIREANVAGKLKVKGEDKTYKREPGPRLWGGVAGPRAQKMKLFHKTNLTTLDRSGLAVQAVCKLFWKDYDCFQYDRPQVCKNLKAPTPEEENATSFYSGHGEFGPYGDRFKKTGDFARRRTQRSYQIKPGSIKPEDPRQKGGRRSRDTDPLLRAKHRQDRIDTHKRDHGPRGVGGKGRPPVPPP